MKTIPDRPAFTPEYCDQLLSKHANDPIIILSWVAAHIKDEQPVAGYWKQSVVKPDSRKARAL